MTGGIQFLQDTKTKGGLLTGRGWIRPLEETGFQELHFIIPGGGPWGGAIVFLAGQLKAFPVAFLFVGPGVKVNKGLIFEGSQMAGFSTGGDGKEGFVKIKVDLDGLPVSVHGFIRKSQLPQHEEIQ